MAELTPYEEAQLEFDQQNRISAANQSQFDPTRSARILTVGINTGIPLELVDADLDNLETAWQQQDFSVDKWMEESPAFAKFAAENPYNLSVLKQDEKNMSYIARAFRPMRLGWNSSWAQEEMNQIGNRRAGGDFEEGDLERLKHLEGMVQAHEFGAENWLNKFIVSTAKISGPMIATIWEAKEEAALGATTGAIIGSQIGAGAGTLVAPGPGTLFGSGAGMVAGWTSGLTIGASVGLWQGGKIQLTGEMYNRYISEGFSHENAALMSQTLGVALGGLEAIGINKVLKYIPGVGQVTRLATDAIADRVVREVVAEQTMKHAVTRLALRYGEVQGTEIAVEILQDSMMTVGTNILARVEDNPDARVDLDTYIESVKETAIETFKGTMLLSIPGPIMSYAVDLRRARDAKHMETVLEYLGEGASKSEILKNVPKGYRQLVEHMIETEGVEYMYIQADRFDEYFQSVGMDSERVAKDLKVKNLQEARDEGGLVEIPMVEYMQRIAPTEHHNGILQDLKTNSEHMTGREARLLDANKPQALQDLDELAAKIEGVDRTQDEQIKTEVMGQLLALNYSTDAAGYSAEVLQGIATLARRMGMEPMDLFKEVFAGVKGPEPSILTDPNADVLIDPLIEQLKSGDIPEQRDIFGPSLVDFLKAKGGLVTDSELEARDVKLALPGLIRRSGNTLDGAAEAAHEAGFIAQRDPWLLLDAIDQEIGGDPVRGFFVTDTTLAARADMLDNLFNAIESLDIDMDLPVAEIRRLLKAGVTFAQTDKLTLDQLTELAFASAEHDPVMLAHLESRIPRIAEKQDFAGIEFVDPVVEAKTGKKGKMTRQAQQVFDDEVAHRKQLKKLLDCING